MHLTKREQGVLSLIGQGKNCDDIASELGISPLTVRKHRSNMLMKLGQRSTAQLVVHAVETQRVEAGTCVVPVAARSLSRREQEVFDLVAAGLTSKEIARRIGITPSTVRKHRERVMRKLGAHQVADIIAMAKALRLCGAEIASADDEISCVTED